MRLTNRSPLRRLRRSRTIFCTDVRMAMSDLGYLATGAPRCTKIYPRSSGLRPDGRCLPTSLPQFYLLLIFVSTSFLVLLVRHLLLLAWHLFLPRNMDVQAIWPSLSETSAHPHLKHLRDPHWVLRPGSGLISKHAMILESVNLASYIEFIRFHRLI